VDTSALQTTGTAVNVSLAALPTTGQVLKAKSPTIATWQTVSGEISGPVSSTDNAIPRFDGTDGSTVQNSTVVIDDQGNLFAGGKTLLMSPFATIGTDGLDRRPSGPSLISGGANIILRTGSGSVLNLRSNNVYIGTGVAAGYANESDTIRILRSAQSTFIGGISFGAGSSGTIEVFRPVTIRSNGQLATDYPPSKTKVYFPTSNVVSNVGGIVNTLYEFTFGLNSSIISTTFTMFTINPSTGRLIYNGNSAVLVYTTVIVSKLKLEKMD
jgi:hypothetical protein